MHGEGFWATASCGPTARTNSASAGSLRRSRGTSGKRANSSSTVCMPSTSRRDYTRGGYNEARAMPAPAIELRRLTKIYREGQNERVVFREVDVTIAPGAIVVLLGRSGSGKSTFLNMLAGIDLPTAGAVIVGGTDLARIDEQARTLFRRRHVGFVFQFFNLIPLLTVEENLRLPLELTGQDDHAGRARARRLLERVGLADRQAS